MKKRCCLILGISLLIGVAPAHAWRDTYDDCIIKNVTEGMSSRAINALELSCARKHFDTATDSAKIKAISSSIEDYKASHPEFYEWVIKNNTLDPRWTYSELTDRWVQKNGYPKR